MAKNTFFKRFENAKNANFDRLTWMTNCDIIIEHIRNLIISSDSSLNSVSDRVLEHVPKFKTDQNMLISALGAYSFLGASTLEFLYSFL